MNNIIFVFPGQGAQYEGMGKDIFKDFAAARYAFQEISDISKKNIKDICFNQSSDVLKEPENSSLATFSHSIAVSRVIESYFGKSLYDISYAMAGHSMGQYTSLCLANSISIKDSIDLLSKRNAYILSSNILGGMICIIGLAKEKINEVIFSLKDKGFAEISNHNASDQFVISGDNNVLDDIIRITKDSGASYAKRVNVSIPAHCKMMSDTGVSLRKYLLNINVKSPKTRWFSNHNADIIENPDDIKESLANQMTHGVLWFDTMEKFSHHKITHSYELGPGKVLSRLINNSGNGCVSIPVSNSKGIEKILKELGNSL